MLTDNYCICYTFFRCRPAFCHRSGTNAPTVRPKRRLLGGCAGRLAGADAGAQGAQHECRRLCIARTQAAWREHQRDIVVQRQRVQALRRYGSRRQHAQTLHSIYNIIIPGQTIVPAKSLVLASTIGTNVPRRTVPAGARELPPTRKHYNIIRKAGRTALPLLAILSP